MRFDCFALYPQQRRVLPAGPVHSDIGPSDHVHRLLELPVTVQARHLSAVEVLSCYADDGE